jgi:glycosyltransferase involved in cell wall biosynthesis
MPRAAFWASLSKTPEIPLIYTEHNTQRVYPGWSHWLFRCFVPRTDHVIAVSTAAAAEFEARWGSRPDGVTAIPTGAPVRDLHAQATAEQVRQRYGIGDAPLICAVGAVRPPKAYHNLVRAVSLLSSKGANVRALIVGSTDVVPQEAARVEQEIRVCKAEDAVQLTGHVPCSYDFIEAAYVVVLSSVQEGLPRALLEAMAAGKPVVATDVGGCAEAVVHGETGLVVPPEDPAALAGAIKHLLDHPDEARRMGEAGRRRVEEHFTLEAMVAKHVEVYQRVLAEAR